MEQNPPKAKPDDEEIKAQPQEQNPDLTEDTLSAETIKKY